MGDVTSYYTLHGQDIRNACKQVAACYYGAHGLLAYELFEGINAQYFGGALPWTLIVWGLTPHGGCLGHTNTHGPAPVITLHPSLLGGTEKVNPWNIPADWLGVVFACDVLIHECMHVAVNCVRGGRGGGDSSHNNPAWVAEVNRLAPLLGFPNDATAGMNRPRRMKKALLAEGEKAVRRVNEGTVPFDPCVKGFPDGYRIHFGTAAAYYQAGRLPFTCNGQLSVTFPTKG